MPTLLGGVQLKAKNQRKATDRHYRVPAADCRRLSTSTLVSINVAQAEQPPPSADEEERQLPVKVYAYGFKTPDFRRSK